MDCSVIEKISSSQAAKKLAEYCRKHGLDPRAILLLTPLEIAELVEAEPEQAETLLRKLREAVPVETIRGGRLKDYVAKRAEYRVLKTRVEEFDAKTPWRGLRFGAIYGFAGEFGTGKSLMAMQIAAYAAAEGMRVVYVYTEGQMNTHAFLNIISRAASELGVDAEKAADKIEVYDVVNSYALQQLLISLPMDVQVVIIDSIIEPFRAEFKGRELLQRRQQELHYVVNLLKRRCVAFGALAVVTNQVMDVPEVFAAGVKRPTGGNVLAHTIDYIFMMHRPNKKKLEGVMWPLDVPGMSPETEIKYSISDDGLH